MKKILPYLKNKYIVTILAFVVWLMFFDRNDLVSQFNSQKKLHQLQKDKKYYLEEIDNNRKDMQNLISNPKNLEKFAREKYLMKKDNEDVFVFVKEEGKSKK